jgi:hypothetical protein
VVTVSWTCSWNEQTSSTLVEARLKPRETGEVGWNKKKRILVKFVMSVDDNMYLTQNCLQWRKRETLLLNLSVLSSYKWLQYL